MTREDALIEIGHLPIPVKETEELEDYVQKKLGLSKEEYHTILNDIAKSHKEYPNDEWIIKLYSQYKNKFN